MLKIQPYKISGILVFFISLLILTTGCGLFPNEEETLAPPLVEPEEITYKTEEAKVGYIEDGINCNAYFEPALQQNIFFRNKSGRFKAIHVILGDTVKKGDLLAELLTDGVENDISSQMIIVDSKEKDYFYSKQIADLEIDIAKKSMTDIQLEKLKLSLLHQQKLKKNDLELARLRLSHLKEELAKCSIESPIDGIVTYTSDVREGEYVDAYRTIVTVADPKNLKLQYKGNEAEHFKLGMSVELKIEDNIYQGEVVLTPYSVPFEDREKYEDTVLIKVDGIPESVEKGDKAEVKLVLESSENTVIVPLEAVGRYMGKEIVYVLENDLRNQRYVETGVKSVNEVEILKGIETGEKVIVE